MPKKTYIRDNPDGTPYFNYDFSADLNPETHSVVLTGPISGPITLSDGTQYNVTDFCIPVLNEHVDELTTAIAQAHADNGTFDPFKDMTPDEIQAAITKQQAETASVVVPSATDTPPSSDTSDAPPIA